MILSINAVIQSHIKTSAGSNNSLLQFFVSMTASYFASGYIIQIIYPLYIKRQINSKAVLFPALLCIFLSNHQYLTFTLDTERFSHRARVSSFRRLNVISLETTPSVLSFINNILMVCSMINISLNME